MRFISVILAEIIGGFMKNKLSQALASGSVQAFL